MYLGKSKQAWSSTYFFISCKIFPKDFKRYWKMFFTLPAKTMTWQLLKLMEWFEIKKRISQESNMNFPRNKKILKLRLKDHINRGRHFLLNVTFKTKKPVQWGRLFFAPSSQGLYVLLSFKLSWKVKRSICFKSEASISRICCQLTFI